MVDLLGPANATNAVTVRPPETRIFGADDTFFKDCSSEQADDGTDIEASFLNGVIVQLRRLIRLSGIAETNDDEMIAKAVRSQAMNYRAVGGTANALTITLDPWPASWAELIGVPLRVKTASANTGAATLAVAGATGTKAIQRPNGTTLQAGDLPANTIVEMMYDGTAVRVLALPNMGFTSNLGMPGWMRFPNGFMMQWGAGNTGGSTVTFPIAFPTSCFLVLAVDQSSPVQATQISVVGAGNFTTTGFSVASTKDFMNSVSDAYSYLALGQ
jgi:hypothetical protein